MKRIYFNLSLLFLAGTTLVSCGFHLRGYTPLPAELQVLYVQSAEPYSAFIQILEATLVSRGFTLVESPEQADVTLEILKEERDDQIGAISASTETRQYLLYNTVTFQIKDSTGTVLVDPRSVTVSRSFIVDANQVLGSTSAELTLEQEMRQELVQRVINALVAPITISAVLADPDLALNDVN